MPKHLPLHAEMMDISGKLSHSGVRKTMPGRLKGQLQSIQHTSEFQLQIDAWKISIEVVHGRLPDRLAK